MSEVALYPHSSPPLEHQHSAITFECDLGPGNALGHGVERYLVVACGPTLGSKVTKKKNKRVAFKRQAAFERADPGSLSS